ncbi:Uncharacterized protein Adt_41337 [Abeliophyllum distichum]|uniref:Uncharacterized protein n=1 Tax=Abeliophyllum distichum TaxID=126358 RepID=A0ABD1PNJ5_9LAMI
MKFSTPAGVDTIKENQESARECYLNALKKEALRSPVADTLMMVNMAVPEIEAEGHIRMDDTLDPRILESSFKVSTVKELEEFLASEDDQSKQQQIGCGLELEMKRSLKEFLKTNVDVFA